VSIKDVVRSAKKEISEGIIINTNGEDKVYPLEWLKKHPLHMWQGGKLVQEIRYQGEKGRKALRTKPRGEVDFKAYWHKDGMQLIGFLSNGDIYLKVKGGGHDVYASIPKDDVHNKHKLNLEIQKLLGYKVYLNKGGGWHIHMPKNK
jgi:hypothetical protein